ncbi:uncharacterized protein CC84DRAFT_1168991 [Paraphaeosphaeria sporulosa]|uniref:Uncharacterized protein n=1 Tax=Paraphaeosphaeria sporulosa TaxID=1460663 RepID=A0A177BZJ7_9PLEO|nr:uncharacterized protein CC84DRAFT_1168991 [Paraphaeosphaeria sporulosa]OAG00139.1 hypothetical protein CC84DRAFT_1168991 [Paraphaeosphaeria sporulosa]
MLEQLIIIIDGRLGAHRHAMLTMQQIIEARFSEVDERFEDVEAVAGEVETAVQGHHVDIRFIRDSIDAFKAHVEKQHGSLYEYFRITKALLDATDADVRVIRENVTGLTGQVSKAVQRICSLETLAKEAEELFKQQLAAVQGNITTINQRLTSGLEKLTITDKKATAAQTQIAGVTSKLRALQDCFATYNAWWADANTQFRTLLANIAKTNMAVATLRNTSTLHKDYILFLYSQVLPEFSRDALQTYTDTVVDAQPGAPLQVDVVLNERVQSALLRMLGEQMGPEASRAGSRTAPARDQQGDEALKPGPLRIRKKAPVGHAAEALTDRFLRELEAAQCGPSAGNE